MTIITPTVKVVIHVIACAFTASPVPTDIPLAVAILNYARQIKKKMSEQKAIELMVLPIGCVRMHVQVWMCVCVCVCERERVCVKESERMCIVLTCAKNARINK